jgi:hypothetical protein
MSDAAARQGNCRCSTFASTSSPAGWWHRALTWPLGSAKLLTAWLVLAAVLSTAAMAGYRPCLPAGLGRTGVAVTRWHPLQQHDLPGHAPPTQASTVLGRPLPAAGSGPRSERAGNRGCRLSGIAAGGLAGERLALVVARGRSGAATPRPGDRRECASPGWSPRCARPGGRGPQRQHQGHGPRQAALGHGTPLGAIGSSSAADGPAHRPPSGSSAGGPRPLLQLPELGRSLADSRQGRHVVGNRAAPTRPEPFGQAAASRTCPPKIAPPELAPGKRAPGKRAL